MEIPPQNNEGEDAAGEALEKKVFDKIRKSVETMIASEGNSYNLAVEQTGDNELTIKFSESESTVFSESESTVLPEQLLKLSVSEHMMHWSYNNPATLGHEGGYLPYKKLGGNTRSILNDPQGFALRHMVELYKDLREAMRDA